ncbi:MAG TPA: hypothetical protein VF630_09040 [Hymenobacter sp.]
MATTPSTSVKAGGGLFGTVFLVLLVLKLVGVPPVAAWSWWRVTSPLWAPWVLIVAALVLGLAWAGVLGVVRRVSRRA